MGTLPGGTHTQEPLPPCQPVSPSIIKSSASLGLQEAQCPRQRYNLTCGPGKQLGNPCLQPGQVLPFPARASKGSRCPGPLHRVTLGRPSKSPLSARQSNGSTWVATDQVEQRPRHVAGEKLLCQQPRPPGLRAQASDCPSTVGAVPLPSLATAPTREKPFPPDL